MPSNIQSVHIPKNMFTINSALKWIRSRGFIENYHNKGIDITDKFYRFRQYDPRKNGKYYTKVIENGIQLVIEIR